MQKRGVIPHDPLLSIQDTTPLLQEPDLPKRSDVLATNIPNRTNLEGAPPAARSLWIAGVWQAVVAAASDVV